MDLRFAKKIQRSKHFKELSKEKIIIDISDTHHDYHHLTFRIRTLMDYIRVVKLLDTVHNDDETLVFRGMSNSEWPPIPSLARYTGRDEFIEHDMVNEFLTLRPDAFQGLQSNFEILAKMQHYGLPTRLLDFTLNPLVALYFACSECPKSDARVLCSSTYLTDNQSDIVESICGKYKILDSVNLKVEDITTPVNLSPYEYISRLYLRWDSRLLFAKPLYWNQRIVNQSAVFLIFPSTLFDRLGQKAYYKEQTCGFTNNQYEQQQIEEILSTEQLDKIYPVWQPHVRFKKTFLEQLELHSDHNNSIKRNFTVNFRTMQKLFSCHKNVEIVDSCKHYSPYGEKIFKRRFLFNGEIEPIDEESMNQLFCSIIIEKKAKKELLSDLASVGVDKPFIYPELEYTAEKIKKKYF